MHIACGRHKSKRCIGPFLSIRIRAAWAAKYFQARPAFFPQYAWIESVLHPEDITTHTFFQFMFCTQNVTAKLLLCSIIFISFHTQQQTAARTKPPASYWKGEALLKGVRAHAVSFSKVKGPISLPPRVLWCGVAKRSAGVFQKFPTTFAARCFVLT